MPQVEQSTDLITIEAGPAQIEELARLGAITPQQLADGRAAGGLAIRLPGHFVNQWHRQQKQLEELAQRIHSAGLSRPARLFLAAGRPLSFLGSQLLLVAQPIARLIFGQHDQTGTYSGLLENRENIDRLLARLHQLENSSPTTLPTSKEYNKS